MTRNIIIGLVLILLLAACAPQAQATSLPAVVATNLPSTVPTLVPTVAPTIPPTALPLTKLNACYSSVSPTQAAAWYAQEKGLFQKYGLDIELTFIASGSKAVAALISGDMDICQVAISGVVNAVAAGKDVVYIAGLVNTYPGSLYVKPEIRSAEQLKGRTLAVSQPGSANTVATNLVLMKMGLQPGDVTLLSFDSESGRYIALETGQVDGALLFPPATLKAHEKGFTNLYDLGKTRLPYQFVGIGTSQTLIKKDRAAVIAFVKAMTEAVAMMKKDPDGTKAVLAKYLELDPVAEAANLEETYQEIILKGFESRPYPTIEGIQTVIDSLAPDNPDAAKVTPAQTIDLSILNEIEQSGFFNQLP
ncbi:MAG: ABC transporter substrate-binding protein [Chloroflexi bacterium]|nr:ABC transporter substrate-binding protein [Chloroflexota bacterium]